MRGVRLVSLKVGRKDLWLRGVGGERRSSWRMLGVRKSKMELGLMVERELKGRGVVGEGG